MGENCKIYVGNLADGSVTEQMLEDNFSKFGSVRSVWMAKNPPGFAFVEFDDPGAANDAVSSMDGQ